MSNRKGKNRHLVMDRAFSRISAFILFVLLHPAFPVCSADWSMVSPAPTESNLYGVWGSGPDDVFAVGAGGVIVHYDGIDWSAMNSGAACDLNGVWGDSGSDVFAVGDAGTILHYDGAAWSAMDSGATTRLCDVWCASGMDVFAVGSGQIFHFDGSAWSHMHTDSAGYSPAMFPSVNTYGVWGASASDVFAVGYYEAHPGLMEVTYGGRLLHYNGISWQGRNSYHYPFYDVWGVSGTDVYAVGGDSIYHYDGTSWSSFSLPDNLSYGNFSGVSGASGADVFAVGAVGLITHYDGSAWTKMGSGISRDLYAVWASADAVFAVGDRGTILKYERNTAQPGDTGADVQAGACGSLDSNLKMSIPAVSPNGTNCFQMALDFYPNPEDPANLYWQLKAGEIEAARGCYSGGPSLDPSTLSIAVPCIQYGDGFYGIVLDYSSPSQSMDPSLMYWRLSPASTGAAQWIDPVTGMEFVWVKGGCFQMGCGDWAGVCGSDQLPAHPVCLDGFFMGKYEVTQNQWQTVMGNNPSGFSDCGPDCPVEQVSFAEVQDFIEALNNRSARHFICPRKPNGNTRPEAAASRRPMPGVPMSIPWPGMIKTPVPRPIRWGASRPTARGFTT